MSDLTSSETETNILVLVGDRDKLEPIINTLDFFRIPFMINPKTVEEQNLALFYSGVPYGPDPIHVQAEPALHMPSEEKCFQRFLSSVKVKATNTEMLLKLRMKLYGSVKIHFQVSRIYFFHGPVEEVLSFKGIPLILRVKGTSIYLLSVDIAGEIKQHMDRNLDLKPSLLLRQYSRLPLTSLAPRRFGNKMLGLIARADVSSENYFSHLNCLDGLRYFLLAAITIASGRPNTAIAFWKKGSQYAATITHDVDTRYGFEEGSTLLRSVERNFGVRSAWNIPTGCYRIKPEILRDLTCEGCEIGSHGYRHDGNLIFATENELVTGLQQSKNLLTKISRSQVTGFRAPLLQHSKKILLAAQSAGFTYDSSLPAWETYSRVTGKSHGICSVYPMNILKHIVELTVTLPQDHQLLYVGRLSLEEILELWRDIWKHIKSLKGLCNVIIHPDKDLFGRRDATVYYEKFIEEIVRDPTCWLTTPSEVATWWRLRSNTELTSEGRWAIENATCDKSELEEVIRLVEYRPEDFVFE